MKTLSLSKLLDRGILGNNSRIINYILPYNKRRFYRLVDDKYTTQQVLGQKGIPHPRTFGVCSSISQLQRLHRELKEASSFVVKPSRGSKGNGIIIVEGIQWDEKKKNTFLETTRQKQINYNEFAYYLSLILSGVFSLDGRPDRILFQEKLTVHPDLEALSYRGIPDVRVILFFGFPVMAMVRLPSESSGGRGNLHQGAVGCGIDLKSGQLTYATQNNALISHHPDFPEMVLQETFIPQWEECLEIAGRCSEVFPLSYIGVDIVIDPISGPLVLEVNARPGLSIQIANQKGLHAPLREVLRLKDKNLAAPEKIQWAQAHF
jgi:alpha-L-glutamate ligase-like protein